MPPSGYDARPTTDWYGQKVVSTADHAMVLREIVTHVPRSGNFRLFDATLVLEIDNPQASSSGYAVSVRWQNQVLGYLPDSNIEPYFPELARLAASGVDAVVKARLWTNMDDPNHAPGSEEFTVTVGVQPAGEIVPINDPPLAQWVLIPRGTAITAITDRQIFKVAKNRDSGHYLVTLHLITGGIEIRLDDKYIGTLPASTSENMRALVESYDKQGFVVACHATIDVPDVLVDVHPTYKETGKPLVSPLPALAPYRKHPRDYHIPGRYQESRRPSPTAPPQTTAQPIRAPQPQQPQPQAAPQAQAASAPAHAAQPRNASRQDFAAPAPNPQSAQFPSAPPTSQYRGAAAAGTAPASRTRYQLIPLIVITGVLFFLIIVPVFISCVSQLTDSASSTHSTTGSSSTSATYSDESSVSESTSSASEDYASESAEPDISDSDLTEDTRNMTGTTGTNEKIRGWSVFQARELCHRRVAQQLRSPQSATFESESEFAARPNANPPGWVLAGYVDLPQRSGIVRLTWACAVVPVSSDSAQSRAILVR
ncbi:hypothetical protein [Corynebacterium matruchotii]|uniref:hypothetical protein n=1 Tax=Corynebacterium matruchotii TaxID=43768 RepID=UPI0028E42809|nr:hypothetical protein [Corynebacterium matruchotii]